MNYRTLGVIGGLGLETSLKFCATVVTKVRAVTKTQPSVLCQIVNIPTAVENDLIYGRPSREHLAILVEAINSLDSAGVDKIAVPCNTVHLFMHEMRAAAKAPVFNIIEETAIKAAQMNLKKVGVLASSTTVDAGLYPKELSTRGIETLAPNDAGQKTISDLIFKILNGVATSQDESAARKVMKKLEDDGADAMILGCTDLRMAGLRSKTPIIDSATVLEDAAVGYLVQN